MTFFWNPKTLLTGDIATNSLYKIVYNSSKIIVHSNNLAVESVAELFQIDQKNVDYLLSNMKNIVDIVIPRGGKSLVKKVAAIFGPFLIPYILLVCVPFASISIFPETRTKTIRCAYVSSMAHLHFVKFLCSDLPNLFKTTLFC